ncbi:hypothetical protein G7048_12045 [Diaphorobacter sp. HDW4B]|uniref:hypothetical protein n=1 Tax=Diaphorobacter sp. HDW4B TaxID=2714925 RepID=UPI00140CCA10|nr:hypothetical protein [Diaphorobacter sp. HDW4B]QIL71026.1 hypothetical protein G7048_12045 [Diaphorobacter sp. HDW4B]
MPKIIQNWPISPDLISENIQSLKTNKKVRRVVTPCGKRIRGYFPSLKSPNRKARFESGLELKVLELLELSGDVKEIKTHPYVLKLTEKLTGLSIDYTPDIEIRTQDGLALLEVKGVPYLQSKAQRERLTLISNALRDANVPFFTVLSNDLDDWRHKSLISELLRERPWPRYGIRGANNAVGQDTMDEPSASFKARWQSLSTACDALLGAVFSRTLQETLSKVEVA